MKKYSAQKVVLVSLVAIFVLSATFRVFAQSSGQPAGITTAGTSTAQVAAPSDSTATLPSDPYIQNVVAAQSWLNFLNGRLTWAQSQPELPSYVITNAQYAVNQFEEVLFQEGYTQTLGGSITQPAQ